MARDIRFSYLDRPVDLPRAKRGTPRVPSDLVDYLRDTFPPRCIKQGEDVIEAYRYAAKVELAETLIKFGTSNEDRADFILQED
ncbi:hypothetical protein LZK73_21815 [Neorhizobium galegae]|nr:hypothetical protein LZK73_21815 [Neorhizobium galegae]